MSDGRHMAFRGHIRVGGGFTLVELLVTVTVFALIVAIMLPSLTAARESMKRAWCSSQMRQIMIGHFAYAGGHKNFLPGENGIAPNPGQGKDWANTSTRTGTLYQTGVITEPDVWLCPNDSRPHGQHTYSYTLNGRTGIRPEDYLKHDPRSIAANPSDPWFIGSRKIDSFRSPSTMIMFAEENTGLLPGIIIIDPRFVGEDLTEPRHLGGAVAVYLDGHSGNLPANANLFYDSDYWSIKPSTTHRPLSPVFKIEHESPHGPSTAP